MDDPTNSICGPPAAAAASADPRGPSFANIGRLEAGQAGLGLGLQVLESLKKAADLFVGLCRTELGRRRCPGSFVFCARRSDCVQRVCVSARCSSRRSGHATVPFITSRTRRRHCSRECARKPTTTKSPPRGPARVTSSARGWRRRSSTTSPPPAPPHWPTTRRDACRRIGLLKKKRYCERHLPA